MKNGIHGTPVYASANGWQSESGGLYQLAPSSLGYDAGVRINNFNDNFLGAAEAGVGAMVFGVNHP